VIGAVMAAALAGAVYGRSQAAEPLAEPLDLRQTALFKNGFGFFVGQATFPAGQSSLHFILPAVPVQGTFWLSYPADVALSSAVAERIDSAGETLEAITIAEILKANVGKRVRVTVDEKDISGRIIDFTEDRRMPRIMPYAPGLPEPQAEGREIWPPYEIGLAVIDVNGGTFCLNPQSVQHVTFPDGDVSQRFARTRQTVAVRIQAGKPPTSRSITVSFLAKGITWSPSYFVDISGEDKAQLSAKALIVNETYDLNDVAVQLVTGFPRLKFSNVLSPIGMKEPLEEFLQSLGEGGRQMRGGPERAYAMARRVELGYGGAAMDVAPEYGAAEEGLSAEDLFLYPAGRITLPRDRVAYVPLFTEAVPYEHVYKWDIPDTVDESGQLLPRGPQPPERKEEVWHTIRLENTTNVPWTPAPAEVVSDGTLLGQDELDYTPAGGEANLRIARAADIQAEQQEFEAERKRNAAQAYEMHYDLVTVRGELTAANFKQEAVTLKITKTLSGEVVSSDPQAEIETLAAGLRGMNERKKLTWTVEVAPAEKRQVTYVYRVYVFAGRESPPVRSMPGAPESALR